MRDDEDDNPNGPEKCRPPDPNVTPDLRQQFDDLTVTLSMDILHALSNGRNNAAKPTTRQGKMQPAVTDTQLWDLLYTSYKLNESVFETCNTNNNQNPIGSNLQMELESLREMIRNDVRNDVKSVVRDVVKEELGVRRELTYSQVAVNPDSNGTNNANVCQRECLGIACIQNSRQENDAHSIQNAYTE